METLKRPLEGIRVVELATFIAAPSCGRYLADLGAEVIKVEAPKGDPYRSTAINEGRPTGDLENLSFDLDNANKKDICLNTKSAEGRQVLEQLLGGAAGELVAAHHRPHALHRHSPLHLVRRKAGHTFHMSAALQKLLPLPPAHLALKGHYDSVHVVTFKAEISSLSCISQLPRRRLWSCTRPTPSPCRR